MWTLEADPRLSSSFANLTIFDTTPDMAEVAARMTAAAVAVPRLGQRVVASTNPLDTPHWESDSSFDARNHLRAVALGRSKSKAALYELAARLYSEPFDPSRPLWEFVLITGLPRGRAAMVQRFHHSITDGVGGIRMSEQFLDIERNPKRRPTPVPPKNAPSRGSRPIRSSPLTPLMDLLAWPAGAARSAVENLAHLTANPTAWLNAGQEWTAVAKSVAEGAQLAVGHHSALWEQRGLERAFLPSQLDLADVKTAARALGGSVNDFFVTGAADAAGRYHREFGHDIDRLRMSMPVSARRDRSQAGNSFRPTQHDLPTGEMGVAQRFAAVQATISHSRDERRELSLGPLAGAAGLLPAQALTWIGVRMTSSVDFATSNVRAAPFPVYMAGARMLENYPLGPLANTAFNLTTMSYDGTLFLGLVVDTVAIEYPDRLLAHLNDAYRDLFAAGGAHTPSRR